MDFKHCSWIGSQENAWNRLSKNSPFSHKSRVLNVYSLICIRMTHENWKSHCWLSGQKPLSQLLFCQVRHLYLWIFKKRDSTPVLWFKCHSFFTACRNGWVKQRSIWNEHWNSPKSFDVTFRLKLNFKALGKTWLCFHTFF